MRELKIEERPLDSLVPYARNSRTHSAQQIAALAGGIREFGWTNPCLIEANGSIIAGHGRVMAARVLEMKTVPCIVIDGLTDAQRRALIIWDNKSSAMAEWDLDLLKIELDDLLADGFNMDLTGFTGAELNELWPGEGGRNTGKGAGARRQSDRRFRVASTVHGRQKRADRRGKRPRCEKQKEQRARRLAAPGNGLQQQGAGRWRWKGYGKDIWSWLDQRNR